MPRGGCSTCIVLHKPSFCVVPVAIFKPEGGVIIARSISLMPVWYTNVVGIFPSDARVLRLVTAVVIETHDEWQIAERRHLSEESTAKLDPTSQTSPTTLMEKPLAVAA